MALRWRRRGKDKDKLLCAAVNKPLKTDTYIDDRLHDQLSYLKVVIPIKDGTKWRWVRKPYWQ
jgi:hypothetical protein